MGFYDDKKNVDQYISMCDGYDGSNLYALVEKHLSVGSSLLELGTGPGFDLAHWKDKYKVTASDLSEEFIKRGTINFPDVEFKHLDAVTIDVEGTFDCLYSNKVLHHLNLEELERSLQRQKQVIAPGGLFAHTFWLGEKEDTMHGMYFLFHDREKLLKLVSKYFNVIDTLDYMEFEEGDSIFIIAQNNE